MATVADEPTLLAHVGREFGFSSNYVSVLAARGVLKTPFIYVAGRRLVRAADVRAAREEFRKLAAARRQKAAAAAALRGTAP